MAKKFRMTHSDDGLTIHVAGNPKNPEPGTIVIEFPGGHLELTRCTDNTYWAHLEVVDPVNVVESRVDHSYEAARELGKIPDFPRADAVKKIALRINNTVKRFHPDT